MKKIILTIGILFIISSFAFEDIPILPQDSGYNIEYTINQNELINVNGMKKSKNIEEAKTQAIKNENQKLRFDTRQIIHQRALDFTTRQNNSMPLPRF